MKNCVHCGAHLTNNYCFECDLPQECEHFKVLIRSRYFPATLHEPPELVIDYAECASCGAVLDDDEIPHDADLEEIE